jgi:hypothetical protein
VRISVARLGEISHYWVIVYFGQSYENYTNYQQIWATFSFGKIWVGLHFGSFCFKNTSGHPGANCAKFDNKLREQNALPIHHPKPKLVISQSKL